MSKYRDSDRRFKIILNMGAFVFLAEAWVRYLPEFYYHWLHYFYAHGASAFFLDIYIGSRWIALGETMGLAVFHTLIWVMPYRLLTFLHPIKTVPYLYVLSIGTVALLYIERNGLAVFNGAINLGTAVDWETINHGLIYILPAIIFHGYFSVRRETTEQA